MNEKNSSTSFDQLSRKLRATEQQQERARVAGNFRLVKTLEQRRAYLEQTQRREGERLADVAFDDFQRDRAARAFLRQAGRIGFLGMSKRATAQFEKWRRDVTDLQDFKVPASVSRSEIRALAIAHLRRKRAARVAAKGGQERGKQKHQQALAQYANVVALTAHGLSTREIAAKCDLSMRRVQQLKKRN